MLEAAPEGRSPADDKVPRIFDVLAITAEPPPPLIQITIEVVFAILLARVGYGEYESEEIICVQYTVSTLVLQKLEHKSSRSQKNRLTGMKRTLGKSGLSQHPHKKDRIDEGAQEGLGGKNALKRPVETVSSERPRYGVHPDERGVTS